LFVVVVGRKFDLVDKFSSLVFVLGNVICFVKSKVKFVFTPHFFSFAYNERKMVPISSFSVICTATHPLPVVQEHIKR
jgi:hypothetical protein